MCWMILQVPLTLQVLLTPGAAAAVSLLLTPGAAAAVSVLLTPGAV